MEDGKKVVKFDVCFEGCDYDSACEIVGDWGYNMQLDENGKEMF
jgi:hypothetical protein